jgi:hypothetical protein
VQALGILASSGLCLSTASNASGYRPVMNGGKGFIEVYDCEVTGISPKNDRFRLSERVWAVDQYLEFAPMAGSSFPPSTIRFTDKDSKYSTDKNGKFSRAILSRRIAGQRFLFTSNHALGSGVTKGEPRILFDGKMREMRCSIARPTTVAEDKQ